jgi:hypothetical protein
MNGSKNKTVRLGLLADVSHTAAPLLDLGHDVATDGPVIVGPGSLDQICGGCDRVLIHGLELGQVRNLILRCPCGAYNATDPRRQIRRRRRIR